MAGSASIDEFDSRANGFQRALPGETGHSRAE
jgi:hypothetical protein